MRKIIIAITLTLISLAVLAYAIENTMTKRNDGEYIVEAQVVEGWNIIAGTLPSQGILSDSEIKSSDLEAVWYYAPTLKKYIQVHPVPDDLLRQVDDDVVLTSAMWVYSRKSGTLKYSTLEDYMPLSLRELTAGWNFVSMTPDMYKGNLDNYGTGDEYFSWDSIKGTCNIQKVYFWIPGDQSWNEFSSFRTAKIDEEDFEDFIGNGMVVKVANDCKLSEPMSDVTQPPSIPQ